MGLLSAWAFDQHVADLRPVLEEAMERGEIRRDDVTLLARATLGVAGLPMLRPPHVQHLTAPSLRDRPMKKSRSAL